MAGLLIPQHRARGAGRQYPPATRPTEAVIARPTVKHTGIGLLIDECQRKMQAFKDRHESVPVSFEQEYESLLLALKQEEGE